MEPRPGRVIDGRIVLDDEDELVEGSRVVVLVDVEPKSVRVTDEELVLIREGQRQAREGRLVDARAFLAALRES